MAPSTIAAFWMVSALLVLTPGADWAYAIQAGLRYRTVLPSVGGMLVGHLLATVAVAAGVAALVARSPAVLTVLTVVGAVYLVWLGVRTLAHPSAPSAVAERLSVSWMRQFITGTGTSTLNPKVLLLFLALLPQFTETDGRWPLGVQILVLGSIHVTTCAVVYTSVGAGARVVLSTRPSAAWVVARVAGTAMVAIGVLLLIERLVGH
jgi:threonine/homoserine/homoserine lactone efflux protein